MSAASLLLLMFLHYMDPVWNKTKTQSKPAEVNNNESVGLNWH